MSHKLALTVPLHWRARMLELAAAAPDLGLHMSDEFDNLDANEKAAAESEPDVPISGIRLSDWLHRTAHNGTVRGRRSRRSRARAP
jgi:hypothetical protein